ncbi:uncharacterized protein LOC135496574 [Lineus longissimus]|uniref:uncharacterized protein LOC135496574 n=1 Tax=Lineus longissimus TaxID=88925 RepID=UPI00315D7713
MERDDGDSMKENDEKTTKVPSPDSIHSQQPLVDQGTTMLDEVFADGSGRDKRRQQFKMLMLTGLPILALVAISLYSLQESVQARIDLVEARQTVYFTVQVGWLIHLLQRERDMSVVYLTSTAGEDTKNLLSELWVSTDSELVGLPDWPVNVDHQKRQEFENKASFKAHLDHHREMLRVNSASLHDEILFYTSPMRIFMKWLTDSLKKSEHGTLWKTLIAYQKLISCKIEAGIERALGELFFSSAGFQSRSDFLWYNKEYNAYKAYFQLAQHYSSLVTPVVNTRTNTTSGQNVVESITEMRNIILRQQIHNTTLNKGKWWFSNMTEFQQVLLTIQSDLANLIFNQINEYISETDTNVAISCVMMALAIFMFPLLLRSVLRMTADIERYAMVLADKTKDLNHEKRRTDDLLHQMLPKAVAERLKNMENFNAEYYKEVTILFSGIVGFNRISAELEPIQIVTLLGSLFRTLDEKIEGHEVYKVETIGDTLLVVSGLPTRIGHKHAGEIANLALDILNVTTSDIPESPNGKVRLRLGIHSGPCMAGVVGLKLPRYCLFGDTVNTASRMESTGLPNRIHISDSTNKLLVTLGGYRTQDRGKIQVKGKGLVKTSWLVKRLSRGHGSEKTTVMNAVPGGDVHGAGSESDDEKAHSAWGIEGLPDPRPMLSEPIISIADVEKMFHSNETQYPLIVQLHEGFHF